MKKVAVVILNYKVKDLTLRCIKSVQKSSYENIEIIVLDNNSGDGLEERLKGIKDITFIQTGGNFGYAGGNNIGISKALDMGVDAVMVLNPDTEIDKNAIKILVEKSQEYGEGVYGPKIYFYGSKKIWYAGGIFDQANVLGSHRGVDEIDTGKYDTDCPTDYVTGACFFITKEVIKKVGLFDERFFLYYEDSDFCFRARKAGFKIMYIPEAIVYHENAKSTGLGTPLQDYFMTRNRMLFASKFLSLRTRFALFREAVRNRKNINRKMALSDFLIGNFGKGSFLP